MPKIIIEGQIIEVLAEHCADDATLRRMLAPYWPDAANAAIERTTTEEGEESIRVAKRAGTKGNFLKSLVDSPQCLSPAQSLAWQIEQAQLEGHLSVELLLAIQDDIDTAIACARKECDRTERTLQVLKKSTPIRCPDRLWDV